MSSSEVSVPASSEVRARISQLLPGLRLRALRLCRDRDAADDLVQETALRALSFEASYRDSTNLKAWLNQVLFSVFITRCRRRRRAGRFVLQHAADPNLWCNHGRAAEPNEGLSPPVRRALSSLPEHFGRVVMLVDLQELSYGEAARQLGVPIGTVMSRLHRGRRLLAAELAPVPERQAA